MAATPIAEDISTKLLQVIERAKRDPEVQFLSLAHLLDEEQLTRSYQRLRKGASAGVDGITKDEYGVDLAMKIADLHKRLRSKRWRHQQILRVHIPKEKGTKRAISLSTVEDKIVQGALAEVLGAVYEPIFRDVSYGFRPGRSAHDALRALNQTIYKGEANWILEADIETFFDSIDRKMLMEILRERVADSSILRLIGKCLHGGSLAGTHTCEPPGGVTQGSALSPLLGNVYLHYVLDVWFERDVLPRLRGKAQLVRFADDFVISFEFEGDAKRVRQVLGQRLERFGLTLHPDKTRLIPFNRPRTPKGKGPATFDFLGFTHYWGRAREGYWLPRVKTRTARLRRSISSIADWCRRHRHLPVKEQHAALVKRTTGHLNYFAVNGNMRSLQQFLHGVRRVWHKWLNRRSQRSRLIWERYCDLLRDFPLPRASIQIQIW
jgi:group II intron reverse transcriptase/maturase